MKSLSGTIGFMMLFALPQEFTLKAVFLYSIWLSAAVGLLAYAGAFRKYHTIKGK